MGTLVTLSIQVFLGSSICLFITSDINMTGNSDFLMVLYLPMKVLQHIKDKRMHPVSAPNGLMSRFESESIRNYFSSSFDVSTRSRVRYRVCYSADNTGNSRSGQTI